MRKVFVSSLSPSLNGTPAAICVPAERNLERVKAEAEEGPQDLLPRTQKMYSDKVNFYNAIIPKKELVVQKAKSHYDALMQAKQQAILKLEEDHRYGWTG